MEHAPNELRPGDFDDLARRRADDELLVGWPAIARELGVARVSAIRWAANPNTSPAMPIGWLGARRAVRRGDLRAWLLAQGERPR